MKDITTYISELREKDAELQNSINNLNDRFNELLDKYNKALSDLGDANNKISSLESDLKIANDKINNAKNNLQSFNDIKTESYGSPYWGLVATNTSGEKVSMEIWASGSAKLTNCLTTHNGASSKMKRDSGINKYWNLLESAAKTLGVVSK